MANYFLDSNDKKQKPWHFKAVPKSREKQKKEERRQRDVLEVDICWLRYILVFIYHHFFCTRPFTSMLENNHDV
jgi:hypothetical protein